MCLVIQATIRPHHAGPSGVDPSAVVFDDAHRVQLASSSSGLPHIIEPILRPPRIWSVIQRVIS
jgi:hypothetical protein